MSEENKTNHDLMDDAKKEFNENLYDYKKKVIASMVNEQKEIKTKAKEKLENIKKQIDEIVDLEYIPTGKVL